MRKGSNFEKFQHLGGRQRRSSKKWKENRDLEEELEESTSLMNVKGWRICEEEESCCGLAR